MKTSCCVRKEKKERQRKRETEGLYIGLRDQYMTHCAAAIAKSMTRAQLPLHNYCAAIAQVLRSHCVAITNRLITNTQITNRIEERHVEPKRNR